MQSTDQKDLAKMILGGSSIEDIDEAEDDRDDLDRYWN